MAPRIYPFRLIRTPNARNGAAFGTNLNIVSSRLRATNLDFKVEVGALGAGALGLRLLPLLLS